MENKFGARVKAAEQDPAVRRNNFEEVSLGYTAEQAVQEAQRCLNCKKPRCKEGCPISTDIPNFISKIKEDKLEEAFYILKENNFFSEIKFFEIKYW